VAGGCLPAAVLEHRGRPFSEWLAQVLDDQVSNEVAHRAPFEMGAIVEVALLLLGEQHHQAGVEFLVSRIVCHGVTTLPHIAQFVNLN